MAYFRETGLPDPAYTASATAAGTMVPLQDGKNVIVYDVLSSAACELRDGSSPGQVMMYVPAGHSNLTSPIKWTTGKPVELIGTSNITITYDVV